MSIKVFVDGQEGTTGLMIHKRLLARPDVQMLTIDPALRQAGFHAVETDTNDFYT